MPYATQSIVSGPFWVGTVISYNCFTGIGGGDITCQEGGIWTQIPTCKNDSYVGNVYCGDPGQLQNALRSARTGPHPAFKFFNEPEPFPVGSQVTYSCKDGFNGGGSRLCQANGQWTPRPTCISTGNNFNVYHFHILTLGTHSNVRPNFEFRSRF